MNQKNKAVTGVLMIVILFFAIIMMFAFYTFSIFKNSDMAEVEIGDGQIAVIEIEGTIMESKKTIEKLEIAEDDKDVKAIILRVDSPGGAVGPTQEIYEEVIRIDKKKPIFASFGSVAASGGYYIGAAARKIYSNAGSLTGSIGVIMQFYDLSKLYELAKVTQLNIKSGKYKDIGQPNRPMTEEEKVLLESVIKGVHQQFVDDIMARRKDKIKGDIKELAQGQIFSGKRAYELGLVDEIGSLWTAGRKIHDELNLKGKFGLRFIKKKKKPSIMDFIEGVEGLMQKVTPNVLHDSGPRLMFTQ